MPYENEYVPDDEVQKYGLHDIWNRYHPFNPVPHAGFQHTWTVDRDCDSFLIRVKIGREEEARMNTFIFRFGGVLYEVKLQYHSSGETDESPYFINWRLLELNPKPGDEQMRSDVFTSLAQALKTFGYWGIVRQIPNTVVELDW